MFNLYDADEMEGHKFEAYIGSMFACIGFISLVTKGSGDQGVDVIVKTNRESYAIQTKCFQNCLSNKPVQEVAAGRMYYKCDYAVVITNAGFTEGAKELAISTGVEMWDYKKLDIAFRLVNRVINKVGKVAKTSLDSVDTDSLFTRLIAEAARYEVKDENVKLYKEDDVLCTRVNSDTTLPFVNVNKMVKNIKDYFIANSKEVSEKLLDVLREEVEDGKDLDETMVKIALTQLTASRQRVSKDIDNDYSEDAEELEASTRTELIETLENVLEGYLGVEVTVGARSTKYYIDLYIDNGITRNSLVKAYKSGFGGKPFSFSINGFIGEETVGSRHAINRKDVAQGIEEYRQEIVDAYYKLSVK